jgi:YVTN family beta-propeller protein
LAINADGDKLWVSTGNAVRELNTANGQQLADIGVPGAWNVALSPDGNKLYVTNNDDPGRVYVINTTNDSLAGQIATGTYPMGVAFSPDGWAYVTNNGDGTVTAISPVGVTTTITVGAYPRGVGVNPAGNRLYVANQGSNSLWWFAL